MLKVGVPIWFGYGTDASPDKRLNQTSTMNILHDTYIPRQPVYDVLTAVVRVQQQVDILTAQATHSNTSSTIDSSSYYGYLLQSPNHAPTEAFVRRRDRQTNWYMTKMGNTGQLLWRPSPNLSNDQPLISHEEIVLKNIFFQCRQRPRETYT